MRNEAHHRIVNKQLRVLLIKPTVFVMYSFEKCMYFKLQRCFINLLKLLQKITLAF